MALITLTSATGSPGITTTAVGLALTWPRDVLLADCDRDPAQAVPAGWLRGVETGGRGLGQLAQAHRGHRRLAEEVWMQTVALDEDNDHERRFLPGFQNPGAVALFAPVWQELVDGFVAMGEQGTDVLVDAGRIGHDGLPSALLQASDMVLVGTRTSLRALAALRLHLPTLQAQLEALGGSCQLGLLLVGANQPYGAREIEQQFGIPVTHTIAWEPKQARVFSDGEAPSRGWGSDSLTRSCRAASSALAQLSRRRDEVLAGALSSDEWVAR